MVRKPPGVPDWTLPVHTCGDGCRQVAVGATGVVDHYGWPADYQGPLPQLGCGLVCVPALTCGGCPLGTPANPVDAKPVHADVERSATPTPPTPPPGPPACTCGSRPGQGHLLRCAVYA